MSKTTRQRKLDAKALADARKLTPGKIFRLVLKSLLFATVLGLLITFLPLLGVPESLVRNTWFSLGLMLVVYIVAYPFLMSEFRVPRDKR